MMSIEFEKHLWLSSVQLVRVDDANMPTGIASGALIDYHGKRLLLTVSHATGDQARWAVQLAYVPGQGTKMHALGPMNFLTKGSLAKPRANLEDVDFSYVEVPAGLRALRQELDLLANTIKAEAQIRVHTPSLTDVPTLNENYGFCGMVLPALEQHSGMVYFRGEIRVYSGLKFLRTGDDFHYFSLPFPHPGHEHFEGCSGAPVLNEKGMIVGLLCGGDTRTNEICAISLSAYKTPVDILVGNIRQSATK